MEIKSKIKLSPDRPEDNSPGQSPLREAGVNVMKNFFVDDAIEYLLLQVFSD